MLEIDSAVYLCQNSCCQPTSRTMITMFGVPTYFNSTSSSSSLETRSSPPQKVKFTFIDDFCWHSSGASRPWFAQFGPVVDVPSRRGKHLCVAPIETVRDPEELFHVNKLFSIQVVNLFIQTLIHRSKFKLYSVTYVFDERCITFRCVSNNIYWVIIEIQCSGYDVSIVPTKIVEKTPVQSLKSAPGGKLLQVFFF